MALVQRIKDGIGTFCRKLIWGYRATPEGFLKRIKELGVKVGEGCVFFAPESCVIDLQNPKLLSFGSNVRVTNGTVILTHDFSWSVVAGYNGDCIGGVEPVTIGDNVFIGMHSIILKGTTIGNNVIIGAGSVVHGVVESESVYAGNPARRIMSLEEFYQRRLSRNECYINSILDCINTENQDEVWKYLREYSCQFSDAPHALSAQIMKDSGYEEMCIRYRENNDAPYDLNSFLKITNLQTDDNDFLV